MIRRLRCFLWGRVVEVLVGRLGSGILLKMVVGVHKVLMLPLH